MAICGLILVSAPSVFGILNTLSSRSRGTVPDAAELLPPGTGAAKLLPPGTEWKINVPGGASLTVPSAPAQDPFPVTPGTTITGKNVIPVILNDGTIVLKGNRNNLTMTAEGAPADTNPVVEITPSAESTSPVALPPGRFPFVTIKVAGFATIELPAETTAQAPGGTTTFKRKTLLRVPQGNNVIVADFRSLIPAALLTMFGIGAELGILGVLAFSLSNRTLPIRWAALALVIVMAGTVLGYAIATTRTLAGPTPGSALTANLSTATIL